MGVQNLKPMESIDYKKAIAKALSGGQSPAEVARRIYLSYPTFSFREHPDREYEIKNAISLEYQVDISSIHFGGSGKTGASYHKDSSFKPGASDLDAAIISNSLYSKFLEEVVIITDGFKDLTRYDKRTDDVGVFKKRLTHGILIPEFMPSCNTRTNWLTFFENLSQGNTDLFKDVNCWIYSSQAVYEWKFSNTIKLIKSESEAQL